LTIHERYERILGEEVGYLAIDYLQSKFKTPSADSYIVIDSSAFPTSDFLTAVNLLTINEGIVDATTNRLIAAHILQADLNEDFTNKINKHISLEIENYLGEKWDIFSHLDYGIRFDYALLTSGRNSHEIHNSNIVIGNELFVEEGAKLFASVINTSTGPVYIGKDAEIMEGSVIRGPFAIGEHSALKLGTKIYGPTVLGPECKVGGEVNNSVFTAYSSKAHDGFLGNSVVGEWCNIGADSNNSNLKNNYENVKLWSIENKTFEQTGLQFCGLFLGDHSKCGINTMFNTGTVVGVSSNIFGAGFPRNFISSFSWGGASGFTTYQFDKAIQTADKVLARRKLSLSDEDLEILQHVFELSRQETV